MSADVLGVFPPRAGDVGGVGGCLPAAGLSDKWEGGEHTFNYCPAAEMSHVTVNM